MFHVRRTLRSSRTTRRARGAMQSRPRKLLLASPRRVCIPQVQPEDVLAPWGLVGGARFFRLCLHSHCSAVAAGRFALAVGDGRRVDRKMTMHAMAVDAMSWSADRQWGIPETFILNI